MNTSYVRHRIKQYFPREEVDDVFRILRKHSDPIRPDFTYYAILRLSRGDKAQLQDWVEQANVDLELVLQASRNVESWEHIVAGYERDVAGSCPYLSSLLDLCRKIFAGPVASALSAYRSHGSLRIRKDESAPMDRDAVVSFSADGLRLHRSSLDNLSDAPILSADDPYASLVPVLESLAQLGRW